MQAFFFWRDENSWNFLREAFAEKGSNVEVQLSAGLISLTQRLASAWFSAAAISDNLPCDSLEAANSPCL